jgi:hypothetical protein
MQRKHACFPPISWPARKTRGICTDRYLPESFRLLVALDDEFDVRELFRRLAQRRCFGWPQRAAARRSEATNTRPMKLQNALAARRKPAVNIICSCCIELEATETMRVSKNFYESRISA